MSLQSAHGQPVDILYRGTDTANHQYYTSGTIFSATHSPEMAQNFGSHVYELDIRPENILLDTTIFDGRELERELGAFSDEVEVILLPGTYKVSPFIEW